MAALSGGIGGGIAGSAAAGSAIAQGIGVATGLQSKFSWAGVAAAGVAAGVGQVAGRAFGATSLSAAGGVTSGNIIANVATGAARSLAAAGARSLIEGTSFGDNIIATLPDVLAQTIVDTVAGGIAGRRQPQGLVEPESTYAESSISGDGFNTSVLSRALFGAPSPSFADAFVINSELAISDPALRRNIVRTRIGAEVYSQMYGASATAGITPAQTPNQMTGNGLPAYQTDVVRPTIWQSTHDMRLASYLTNFRAAGGTANYNDVAHLEVLRGFDYEQQYINEVTARAAPALRQLEREGLVLQGLMFLPLLVVGGAEAALATGGARLLYGTGTALGVNREIGNVQSAVVGRDNQTPLTSAIVATGLVSESHAQTAVAVTELAMIPASIAYAARSRAVIAPISESLDELGRINLPAGMRFGTTTFGQEAHVQTAALLERRLVSQGIFGTIDNTRPGMTGIDMSIADEYIMRAGFEHIEIKPNTLNGLRTLNRQMSRWAYDPASVRAVTYDAQGNLRWGFDF